MTDFSSILEQQQSYDKALDQANALNKTAVFEALAQAGVTSVTVEFDGEGDSGQIESVVATSGDKPEKLPRTPVALQFVHWDGRTDTVQTPLSAAIPDLCYGYLSREHGGWENNDGAYGTFTFDIGRRTIELEFNGRFTDTFTSNHSF
jgi:hypothetical protein